MEKNGIVAIPKMFRQALDIKENDNIIFEMDIYGLPSTFVDE